MTVIFYSMIQCRYCKDAEDLLKNEIASGDIIKKNASESPPGLFKGYPSFLNTSNNLTHTGLISKEQLYKKLLVNTKNMDVRSDDNSVVTPVTPVNTPPEKFCINISKEDISSCFISFIVNDDGSYKLIYIDKNYMPKIIFALPLQNQSIDIKNTQCIDSNLYSTNQKQNEHMIIPYFKDLINDNNTKQFLLRMYPCTRKSDWVDDSSILNLVKKQSKRFMSVQACEKNGLYYCSNNIEKCNRDKFCDTKTKVMFTIIMILVFLVCFLLYNQFKV